LAVLIQFNLSVRRVQHERRESLAELLVAIA
jgi:hypothetical protein